MSIIDDLTDMEKERLTEWQGVAGAAYNVVSVGLVKKGLLKSDWSHTELGEQVRKQILTGEGQVLPD